MKGLILCGGRGSRLRPLTLSRPKQLLPLVNKPVLFYGVEAMVKVGITEIAVVVPPMFRSEFTEVLQDGAPWNIKVSILEQPEPKGMADAIRLAKSFVDTDDFLLYLGDNVIDGSLQPLIDQFQQENLDGLVSVSLVDHPEQFGVVMLEKEKIVKVIEKPSNPPSNLAINGVYLFKPSLFGAIDKITPSARGELELTDAIQRLIDEHYELGVFQSLYWWKDTGKPSDLLLCNQYFLAKLNGIESQAYVDNYSSLSSPAHIGAETQIINSHISGPVVIGHHTKIENAYIGPHTSIGDHVTIVGCRVENSIIISNTDIHKIPQKITGSIIGGQVNVSGEAKSSQKVQLWLGDYSHIRFHD